MDWIVALYLQLVRLSQTHLLKCMSWKNISSLIISEKKVYSISIHGLPILQKWQQILSYLLQVTRGEPKNVAQRLKICLNWWVSIAEWQISKQQKHWSYQCQSWKTASIRYAWLSRQRNRNYLSLIVVKEQRKFIKNELTLARIICWK